MKQVQCWHLGGGGREGRYMHEVAKANLADKLADGAVARYPTLVTLEPDGTRLLALTGQIMVTNYRD